VNPMAILRGKVLKLEKKAKSYDSLKLKHEELINENLVTEQDLEDIRSALVDFCENCSERTGALCVTCSLNPWL